MNNNTQPRFYFSAYPLKVIGSSSSSSLRVMRPEAKDSGIQLRLLPHTEGGLLKKINDTVLPYTDAAMDANDYSTDWFNNYE